MHGDVSAVKLQALWDKTHPNQPRKVEKSRVRGVVGHVRKYWIAVHDLGDGKESFRVLGGTYDVARKEILRDLPPQDRKRYIRNREV